MKNGTDKKGKKDVEKIIVKYHKCILGSTKKLVKAIR